jgi:hypothetical protein
MGTKSRESIYSASIKAAAERAAEARKDAGRLAWEAWNKRMLGFQGPAQPSPALGDALNAGFGYLEVKCLGCDTHQTVALDIVRRPKTTPVHELERYMRCKDCSQVRGYPYKRSHLVALAPPRFRRAIRHRRGGQGTDDDRGESTMNVEDVRATYRPDRITTLFVAESPAANGDFFYYGSNSMLRQMQRAKETVLLGCGGGDFLDRFKALVCFLNDLVLTHVDKLTSSDRRAQCLAAGDSLAARIAKYQPSAIVCLLVRIRTIAETAAKAARSDAQAFCVPFPGMGQQGRFHNDMFKITPLLPRERV